MIPVRFIAEAYGATVTWDDATKTQTIMLNGKTFKLTQNVALPDGMGTPVLVKDRFFSYPYAMSLRNLAPASIGTTLHRPIQSFITNNTKRGLTNRVIFYPQYDSWATYGDANIYQRFLM